MKTDLVQQQCSSRRTSRSIIEQHDRWDGWRYHWRQWYRSLGPLASQYTEKKREYWLKYETGSFWHCDEKSFSKHRNGRNLSRKCTTSLIRRQNHNGEVVDRTWLCFAPSQTCVKFFTCRLMCADTIKCAHVLIRKGRFDCKHCLERLRNHEHSVEHIDATIRFSRRYN